MAHTTFPLTRQAFDKYPLTPESELDDISSARRLAYAINFHENKNIEGGEIAAIGLLGKIFLRIIERYQHEKSPQFLHLFEEWLHAKIGKRPVEETLLFALNNFPPASVYHKAMSPREYLHTSTGETPPHHRLYPSLILILLATENPAMDDFAILVRDEELENKTAFTEITSHLDDFFLTQPIFGDKNQTLLEMLRAPLKASPNSLAGQLEYIRKNWQSLLGEEFFRLLLRNLDIIREEEKLGLLGPGPVQTPDFSDLHLPPEERRFSPDSNWMPKVVLLAKNTYVWLDQLSKDYGQEIARLDQIPDEELAKLSRWGFTALWLIGLWERSSASQRIKQMCGNPDAVSSAYSLYDYTIANDLGGEEAYNNLRHRAGQHGIQMAADMVPNHVGIYSKWVIEHPDWFLSLDEKPYPAYSFNGANLSEDGRAGIYLEDGYYDKTDAAVVFKRVDHLTGNVKYIYHGNDGTAMPWNDTAQLDYRMPQVREAVIQTILRVAHRAPIIRFDAAMTLAKKHYQRLWFPAPGTGGAIPTRAEHGLSPSEFNKVFPKEFWREVVDRVAEETPNTLLLAEAFWMMEGYFVRTLGMHRVYNSAFMNMLRDEDNAKYQDMILKTLAFDPQILKRYVNFMNNPDEDTAISQFGADGKYFGICTLMITLPGLPMFGHGQIQGFTEKYGMEYKRAYYDERPNEGLIARHEREIFPLLHKRYLFAEVDHFVLYKFSTGNGVNQDVFAYSNRADGERGLVVYHNKWGETQGWVRDSVSVNGETLSLGAGLGLENHPNTFTIFRDQVTNLMYIRPTRALFEQGLYVELGAYKTHVFLDFQQVEETSDNGYAKVVERLHGRGVASIQHTLQEVRLAPLHAAFHEALESLENEAVAAKEQEDKVQFFLNAVAPGPQTKTLTKRILNTVKTIHALPEEHFWRGLLPWALIHALGEICANEKISTQKSLPLFDDLLLEKPLQEEGFSSRDIQLIKLAIQYQDWFTAKDTPLVPQKILSTWLEDKKILQFIRVNVHEGVAWFQQEAFEIFLQTMKNIALIAIENDLERSDQENEKQRSACQTLIAEMDTIKEKSEYQLNNLQELTTG